jgi:hypothetical protein
MAPGASCNGPARPCNASQPPGPFLRRARYFPPARLAARSASLRAVTSPHTSLSVVMLLFTCHGWETVELTRWLDYWLTRGQGGACRGMDGSEIF